MNSIQTKARRFELWYLIGAMAIALLLYTGYKWYQSPQSNTPTIPAQQTQNADDYFNKGNEFYKQQNYQEALKNYQEAITINPQHAQAHTMISLLWMRSNNYEHALNHAQKAFEIDKNYIPAQLARGECFVQLGKLEDAKIVYQEVLKQEPNHFESHLLLSQLYCKEMTTEGCANAREHAEKALAIRPAHYEGYFALGDSYLMNGQPNNAREQYEKVNSPAHEYRKKLFIGQTYERGQQFEKAAQYYKDSIALNNSFAPSHVALAGAYFALGKLGDAFKEYEWRWELSNMRNLANKWDGSNLKDKRLIVLSENGIGDIFQYARFIPLVKQQGTHVSLVTTKALVPLFKLCPYIDEIIEAGQAINNFDYVTSMQSIPALLNINEINLPTKPYLSADKKLVNFWKSLKEDTNLKIGICWQPGDDSHLGVDQKRNLSLDQLKSLAHAKNGNVTFYSLQMGGSTKKQIKTASFPIKTFEGDFDKTHGSFMDTAAVMEHLDLVITVDTSIAHLAGALGVKTWIVLPYCADVRWMSKRSNSVWYPTVTLFRQEEAGNWSTVIQKIKSELEHTISA